MQESEIIIPGVIIKKIKKNSDSRGWLLECLRNDEIDKEIYPVMSYISMTYPGKVRGPHEHTSQTDYFCFPGPSTFRIYIWDNRKSSPTYSRKMEVEAGEDNPAIIIIAAGIVHGYKNIGEKEGLVINYPNTLYAGWGGKEKIDEIRYEQDSNSPFKIT